MKLVFMGTPDFAVPSLRALVDAGHDVRSVVTQPDRPKGRRRTPSPPPVKELAVELALDVLQPENVNRAQAIADIRRLEPDAIAVAAYGQKLGAELLCLSPHGCINVHPSLLPKYRGAAPIPAVLLAGEVETGVTIMQMAEAMDAGDILRQEKTPIGSQENAGQLHDRLAELGARLLVETLDGLTRGQIARQPQDHSQATLAPKLSKEHGVIDFRRGAGDLANLVRAVTPWPGAKATLHLSRQDKRLDVRLLETRLNRPDRPAGAEPGAVVGVSDEGIEAAAGQGTLLITRIQQAGKRPLAVAEFLRGHPVKPGDRFGV